MAKITTVVATSHSPFLFQPAELWNKIRDKRPCGEGVPYETEAETLAKHQRTDAAFDKVRDVFQANKPDVLVVFGDDQKEQFDFRNFPAFGVYVGGAFEGYREVAYEGGVPGGGRQLKPKTAEHWTKVETRPDLAQQVLAGLIHREFDPAFLMSLPNEEHGMGHAFMRPVTRLTNNLFDIPVVPILVNCFYAPQPTGARCAQVARAVRDVIKYDWPADLKVGVLGSGGLWHIPGVPDTYLDEDFDNEILDQVRAGDADEMAYYFDNWKPKAGMENLRCYSAFTGGTKMPGGGVGGGTGEVRNWIMAQALASRAGEVVDYVPVYASPCGMGFAYWNM